MKQGILLLILFLLTGNIIAQQNKDGYTRPELVSPANNTVFRTEDLRRPITLRWTPPLPLPDNNNLLYRIRVYEVKEGQLPGQAAKENVPVFEKEINSTQTTWQLPANKENKTFSWTVQAINKRGIGYGDNNGLSNAGVFVLTAYAIQLDDIVVTCTATPGLYNLVYKLTNPNPGTAKLTNFVVTSSTPAGATIASFTPPLNTTILSGAQLVLTGTITASPTLSNICIGAEITDVVNSFYKASRDTCTTVIPCGPCLACDTSKVKIIIPASGNVVMNVNNTLTLTQPITITTTPLKLVRSIKAELVYYEFTPESEDCLPCNKDSKTYGNFDTSTLASVVASGNGTHSLLWVFTPPKNFTTGFPATIIITEPPTVHCCVSTVRWCIRYVVTFDDCTVCNKLVCYEQVENSCISPFSSSKTRINQP